MELSLQLPFLDQRRKLRFPWSEILEDQGGHSSRQHGVVGCVWEPEALDFLFQLCP